MSKKIWAILIALVLVLGTGVITAPVNAQGSTDPIWLAAPETATLGGEVFLRVAENNSEQIGTIASGTLVQRLASWPHPDGERSLIRTQEGLFGWVGDSFANFQPTTEVFTPATTCEVTEYTPREAKALWKEAGQTYYLFDVATDNCTLIFDGQFELYEAEIHDLAQLREGAATLSPPFTQNGMLKFVRGTVAAYPSEQAFNTVEVGKDTSLTLFQSWQQDILGRFVSRGTPDYVLRTVTLDGNTAEYSVAELASDYAKSCEYENATVLVENALHLRGDGLFDAAIGSQGCVTVFRGQREIGGEHTVDAWIGIEEGYIFASGQFWVMPETDFNQFLVNNGLETQLRSDG